MACPNAARAMRFTKLGIGYLIYGAEMLAASALIRLLGPPLKPFMDQALTTILEVMGIAIIAAGGGFLLGARVENLRCRPSGPLPQV